ncbi:MAG: ExbD/TolR family protein [Acidobacteriota bacterium]
MKRLSISAVVFVSILLATSIYVRIRQDRASQRIVVTVDSQGRTFLDHRAVSRGLLADRLREAVELRGLQVVYLLADEELEYQEVMALCKIIRDSGVDAVGLAYVYPQEERTR